MVMHSASLEGYSIPLVLGFCHYSYRPICNALAFDLTLRVHIDDGFALLQIHGRLPGNSPILSRGNSLIPLI
jgi:hypothetical protein